MKDEQTWRILLQGSLKQGLYVSDFPKTHQQISPQQRVPSCTDFSVSNNSTVSVSNNGFSAYSSFLENKLDSLALWHNRLGHASVATVK